MRNTPSVGQARRQGCKLSYIKNTGKALLHPNLHRVTLEEFEADGTMKKVTAAKSKPCSSPLD